MSKHCLREALLVGAAKGKWVEPFLLQLMKVFRCVIQVSLNAKNISHCDWLFLRHVFQFVAFYKSNRIFLAIHMIRSVMDHFFSAITYVSSPCIDCSFLSETPVNLCVWFSWMHLRVLSFSCHITTLSFLPAQKSKLFPFLLHYTSGTLLLQLLL